MGERNDIASISVPLNNSYNSHDNKDYVTPFEGRIEIRLGELNVSFIGNISSEVSRAAVEALR